MPLPSAYKSVPFELLELKASADAWTFSGYASTFGNVDLGGDVVLPGAFTESLKLRPAPRLLWSHDRNEPIGSAISMKEDRRGLFGEWKISKTQRGQDAYTLLKDGAIDSMSIGYLPGDSEFTDDGVRKLKSVDLLEVSLVSMPMNEEAVITAVKGLFGHDQLLRLAELSTAAAAETPPAPEVPEPTDLVVAKHEALTITQWRLRIAHKRLDRRMECSV